MERVEYECVVIPVADALAFWAMRERLQALAVQCEMSESGSIRIAPDFDGPCEWWTRTCASVSEALAYERQITDNVTRFAIARVALTRGYRFCDPDWLVAAFTGSDVQGYAHGVIESADMHAAAIDEATWRTVSPRDTFRR